MSELVWSCKEFDAVAIFSRSVCMVETSELDSDISLLAPGELAGLTANSNERRRSAFVSGRVCAHRAMNELGLPRSPVCKGESREPIWPTGLVGSITHTKNYVAAAVARTEEVIALGIDAEPNRPVNPRVVDRIASVTERDEFPSEGLENPFRLLFAIKEATYKAWFPLTGRWLGFHDVHAWCDVGDGSFVVEVLIPAPIEHFTGRFQVSNGTIIAGVEIPRSNLQ